MRFELGIKALAPEMKIIAPWRTWNIQSREEELEYCAKHNIDLPFKADNSYSRDRNIWHISHEDSSWKTRLPLPTTITCSSSA